MAGKKKTTRRDFIRKSGALAGVATVSAGYWTEQAAADSNSPNQRLNVACIGTANRGAVNVNAVKTQNVVALCDVDRNYLERAQTEFPAARTYVDYRELIDQEAKGLDAVTVSTADHHHAPATLRAIQAGLHVYCEKPLAHTVAEARVIARAAQQHGVVTQMGTQIHATNNYHRVVEIIQSGAIGDVTEAHVWVGKVWSGTEYVDPGAPTDKNIIATPQTPPDSLAWDLWLGPAEQRPFLPGKYHPANWRRWWDFGGGTIADMACHYVDLPFWALKLRHPIRCEAEGPEVDATGTPPGLHVSYDFPARHSLPPVRLTWSDGNRIPKKVAGERVPSAGVMFVGSEGNLFADYSSYRLFPRQKFADFQAPAPSIPKSIGHHEEWIKACKDGSTTTCNFDYSGALSETVLLGNVAYRAGQRLEWDAETLQATNCPEANQFVHKFYRTGWEVSGA